MTDPDKSQPSLFILILAGGSGERFWPLSRQNKPKQLLKLFDEHSLLENTIQRLDGLVPPENILILTNSLQIDGVREVTTTIPEDNILAEPQKRDTAAAIALGAAWISRRDPFATMVVLPADHLIKDTAAFQKDIKDAVLAAQTTESLVTIGIPPTWACPSFGYIEQAEPVAIPKLSKTKFRSVARFREKPDASLAEDFIRQGNFRWNAGMFIWSVNTIISEFNRHAPKLAAFVSKFRNAKDIHALLKAEFGKLPKISIDYAIMERASRVLVCEANFDWDDVGTWPAVAKYFSQDEAHNATNTPLQVSRAKDNIVFSSSKKQTVLMGVNDLIVVETDDALLVCKASEAEMIKEMLKSLPKSLQ